ncbi:uncharacterized protein CLUP02_00118 [Colletotrichum lupini]|uniref:Uncharacterized protein n=1 Tax=Colletotrichum lupini TaxID=145971 RepID=A0A9Q8SAB2_9PEZI|nr:uncharacterized protein CLUP02_00118 [Colletotrichum lupini]UQC73473.1 hypothetical protein CLUP02_00118 [Colletotrichum lupini]
MNPDSSRLDTKSTKHDISANSVGTLLPAVLDSCTLGVLYCAQNKPPTLGPGENSTQNHRSIQRQDIKRPLCLTDLRARRHNRIFNSCPLVRSRGR